MSLRTALVTGGSRGVGAAVSQRLASDGAAVAVHFRTDADAAARTVRAIASAGGRAVAVQADMGEPSAMVELAEKVAAVLGPVDLLVSNAGVASRGATVADTEPAEFERLMRVHVLGPLALLRAVLPGMRAAPRGDVVVISSVTVDEAPARSAPYTMAKAALETAARTLAREERTHGVHVNIVAPGLVRTDMGERLVRAVGGVSIDDLDRSSPFGRVCTSEDVAGVVAFLTGPDSGYVTGHRIVVDGGGRDVSVL